ncbi:MAG: hypothetical protein JWM80_1509 [Cyanobacteria bacterium RYN_339]|nr:hypothetical protein [Cyanobacteria bacterium RYN_339]
MNAWDGRGVPDMPKPPRPTRGDANRAHRAPDPGSRPGHSISMINLPLIDSLLTSGWLRGLGLLGCKAVGGPPGLTWMVWFGVGRRGDWRWDGWFAKRPVAFHCRTIHVNPLRPLRGGSGWALGSRLQVGWGLGLGRVGFGTWSGRAWDLVWLARTLRGGAWGALGSLSFACVFAIMLLCAQANSTTASAGSPSWPWRLGGRLWRWRGRLAFRR